MCVSQEHLHFVTEICQDEVFILDHEGPVVSQGASTGMPDLVVEPTGYVNVLRTHRIILASFKSLLHETLHGFYEIIQIMG